jgi:NADP-dependent alcohol dehydrogenase
VGTELATLTGVTKAAANGILLPAWAAAVAAGDDRWGDPGRLRTAWEALGEASFGTSPDPARGLAALVDRWLGPRPLPPPAEVASAVGERAVRRWGTGVPLLPRVPADDIAALVQAALAGERDLTEVAR